MRVQIQRDDNDSWRIMHVLEIKESNISRPRSLIGNVFEELGGTENILLGRVEWRRDSLGDVFLLILNNGTPRETCESKGEVKAS